MNEDDLFPGEGYRNGNGEAYARWNDPDTAREAAAEVRGERASKLEAVVVVTLKSNPNGLTTHDIVALTDLEWNSISPRIRPLIRKGFVVDSGERRIGKMGKRCIVWKAL